MADQLIHGRFHTLQDKIQMVKSWPGIDGRFIEEDFTRAVEKAQDSGLLKRFEAASATNDLLDVVVSVYLADHIETFNYGLSRVQTALGMNGAPFAWSEGYGSGLKQRLRLFKGIDEEPNTIKVEVIDTGAYWNVVRGCVPKNSRSKRSAHVPVLFAGAQDPDWVRQMGPDVPCALMGGYVLTVPHQGGAGAWVPVLNNAEECKVGAALHDRLYRASALPTVWE